MKNYVIRDEVRKIEGKEEYTHYRYSFERDEQLSKRINIYTKKGYKVRKQKNPTWWPCYEIILLKNKEE